MLKLDLHVHTNASDGKISPEQAIRQAENIGLDGIAITDHDNMDGYNQAKKMSKNIILIPGVEITTRQGDILCYGVKQVVEGDPAAIIRKVHEMKGIAVLAHPFAAVWPHHMVNFSRILNMLDAIEVFNASTPWPSNAKAIKLAKMLKKPGTGGSDAHFLKAIGSGFTWVKTKNKYEILNKIRDGEITVGWE